MATENIIREIEGKSTKDTFKLTVSSKPELRTMAKSLAAVYNDAVLDGNFNPVIEVIAEDNKETVMAVREAMEFIVNKYTSLARTECLDALKATDNPMLEAVKQLTYLSVSLTSPAKRTARLLKPLLRTVKSLSTCSNFISMSAATVSEQTRIGFIRSKSSTSL